MTYSAVWVRLDCGQAKEELPSAGSDGEGEFQEQEEPRFFKRDSVVRRRMSYYA